MDMDCDSQSRMQTDEQDRQQQQQQSGIPTMFTWSYGGKQVGLMGSWDGWKSLEALQGSGEDLDILKVLPSGVYNYIFVVDGQYRVSPDQPYHQDDFGNAAYNILDLKEYVPEDIGSTSGFEAPESPESSYNNARVDEEEEYEKNKPPMLPPHLNLTLLNAPTRHMEIPARPQHVVLNHLYTRQCHQVESHSPYLALGSTQRFRSKYVTTVLYTPYKRPNSK